MIGLSGISAYQSFFPYNRQSIPDNVAASRNICRAAYSDMPLKTPQFSSSASVQEATYEKPVVSDQMRALLRSLKQSSSKDQNPYASSSDRANEFTELTGATDREEKTSEKPVNYNYKEVAAKIQQAKTSVSAEKAVLAAGRKVLEVKRKISSHEGDPEELQLALTHAERMEKAAKKKKRHLELEELAAVTKQRDENREKPEAASSEMKNALLSAGEEKLTKREDAILDHRFDLVHEAVSDLSESSAPDAGELLKELNEMAADFGKEELKELEEAMGALENMEVIDPHMSSEDLENLKRKHRTEENRVIMKADMDYLKGMIRHQFEKGGSIPGMQNMNTGVSGFALPSPAVQNLQAGVMP
ncbi:MAG: hypothetical protein K6G83_06910 [Lachnospiraceae bacterium]|nr:hypothetical protein [Lachnospiraceae bacterium]